MRYNHYGFIFSYAIFLLIFFSLGDPKIIYLIIGISIFWIIAAIDDISEDNDK